MAKDDKNKDSRENKSENDGNSSEIPEMNLENKYSSKAPDISENQEKMQKEVDKTRKELEKLKSFILKKYPFTESIGILPPQAMQFFVKEEEIPKETEKHIQLLVIIPEDKFKEVNKIKAEIVKQIDELQKNLKQKIWIQIKTPVDVWELCLDSKFELVDAISMSLPLHDKGVLGALRVANIHKSLVLQKFDKYIVSYVIAGSLVRGEAVKTSDVDVFIVIDDTDVKRMPILELKERLRAMIYQFISDAERLAGVKNKLSPQVYLLTEFWESVKDAHPIIFTFIRDGIPLYDRHTFLPWKSLLKRGKLKPSPEAIDMFMSLGDNTVKRVKRFFLDILINDIFDGINTPSQALLMLYGLPPPNIKETVKEMRRVFVEKEKMLEKKYIDILEEITIKYYKGYEHGKVKEISGTEIDRLLKNMEVYIKRLKELREQIEKRTQEKTIEEIYNDVFGLLKSILGNKTQNVLIEEFERIFVKKGQFSPQDLRILRDIVKARADFKKGKLNSHTVNEARKNAYILIRNLVEYNQRIELANNKKTEDVQVEKTTEKTSEKSEDKK